MLRWIFGKSQILPSAASADCFCHHCCQHIANIATITIIANIAIIAFIAIIPKISISTNYYFEQALF